jgi:tetratricopeptide (TPR) repeat protein
MFFNQVSKLSKTFCAVAVVLVSLSAYAQVRVWQGTLTLPTYEEGLPDPNPPFDQFTTNRFNYPYTLRTNITSRRVDKEWRAVYLENEYLKCSVLPDIGGHLYTCTDKISGQSMFYNNPSIKKAAISYRGAWAAFGVEFNFPVSHNWVTMSPVNYAFAQHEDGSVSVTVGNIDRVYGMEWSVELVLRPKSTVLEERVRLSNRSDARHRFYWWNNAGVNASDDTHIIYPMRFAATHGFTEVHPWPVDTDGVDYSIVRNHLKGPVSMFTHGSREPFMGVWDPKAKFGVAHYAHYEHLPAKKIWSWGVDADGLDWRKALSDNNSGYLEVQAGIFRNQETYAFLEPRQVITFSEYWMPVRVGDFVRANLAGVVALTRKGSSLMAGFNANQSIPNASISILNDKKVVFHEEQDLAPERTWAHEVANADANAKYTLEIKDAKGSTLIRQTEGEYDWTPESEIKVGTQKSYPVLDPEKRNADDWLQLGKDDELNGRVLRALDTYKDALAKFPDSFELLKAAGRLSAQLLRLEDAKTYLEPLHLRDTSDTEISYYLGLAYDGLGELDHARDAFEQATRLPDFRAAAALQLGELLARKGDLISAEKHLATALKDEADDERTHEELAAIRGALGAQQDLPQLRKRFPLSHLLREEAGRPDLTQLANDPERVLNIAATYMRLGLYQKAAAVLSRKYPSAPVDESEPGIPGPSQHPLVAYYLAYCREKLGQSADYAAASKLSTAYVFPNAAEDYATLRAALKANPQDGAAHYLLGTFYFSRGMTDPALAEWAAARKSAPQLPVLSASTGLAQLHVKHDATAALAAFREGVTSDPDNIAIYVGMDQALSLLNHPSSERVAALQKYPKLDAAPPALVYELALNLGEAGDFDRATDLFRNRFFAREEGGTNVRQVWIEVQLQHALALAASGKCTEAIPVAQDLGSAVPGMTFTNDGLEIFLSSARTKYFLGSLYEKCGKRQEAEAQFKAAASASTPDQVRWAWLSAQKLPDFNRTDWEPRLRSALEQATTRTETSGFPSWWFYAKGGLEKSLGEPKQAEASFQQALLLPDRMLSYHLTRLERAKPQ